MRRSAKLCPAKPSPKVSAREPLSAGKPLFAEKPQCGGFALHESSSISAAGATRLDMPKARRMEWNVK